MALERFEHAILGFFSADDRALGGYESEDRQGQKVFHPLTSLSIGAVRVESSLYHSHHEISAAAAEAKKQAKRIRGNSLFTERRTACEERAAA